jgi:hypothetical protein
VLFISHPSTLTKMPKNKLLAGACLRDLPPPKRFGEGWSRYGEGRRPAEG